MKPQPRKKPPLTPERLELAYRAAALRKDLDDVLKKHGAKLVLGWQGKWAQLQFHFPALSTTEALTVVECTKGGKMRYIREEEEK